ncbi:hypothetical protein HK103_006536 [Boothiomyces macroporosus]|uniref:Ankyrin repeat protein n=1 Tax=Boothiomyces macroporosus TaxID=261099 RepID=A0AAD5UDL3_9FUNG|nr:hypothetical protein HK103_006536 [Boothiomyces macroporosus]
MLNILVFEIDIVASHLDFESYFELRCSYKNYFPTTPTLRSFGYIQKVQEIQPYELIYSEQYIEFPVKLNPESYSFGTFKCSIERGDYVHFKKMLLDDSVSKDEINAIIQSFLEKEVRQCRMGWDMVQYMNSEYGGGFQETYYSLLYFHASQNGHLDIIELLAENPLAQLLYTHNDIFIEACVHGYYEIVKYLVERSLVNVNYRDGSMYSGLVYAGNRGSVEIVKLLLDLPQTTLLIGDLSYILSHFTKDEKYSQIFELFLHDHRSRWNEFDNIILINLCHSGYTKFVKAITSLPGVEVNATAIRYAVLNNYFAILKLLLEKCTFNPFPKVLKYACETFNPTTLGFLLKDPRAVLTLEVISDCLQFNSKNVLKYFAKHNLVDFSDKDIRNLFICYAVKCNNLKLLERLLNIGAPEYSNKIQREITSGAYNVNVNAIKLLLKEESLWGKRLWERASLNAVQVNRWDLIFMYLSYSNFNPSFNSNKLLYFAVQSSKTSTIKKIVTHPQFKYNNEIAPFNAAMRNSDIKATQYLMKHLDFDPGQYYNSLFRNACKYADKKYIEYLLTLDKVDPTVLDYEAAVELVKRKDEDILPLLDHHKFGIDPATMQSIYQLALLDSDDCIGIPDWTFN